MRRLRWIVRLSLALVLAIAMVMLLALVVIQTDWAKDRLRALAVTRVAALLNGQLSIGRLSGSLFRGVTLDDVTLVRDGRTIFTADTVRVRYDPLVLIRRGIILDEIVVEGPTVHARQEAEGWNLARLLTPRAPSGQGPPSFTIRRLAVVGGTVTVEPLNVAARRLHDVAVDMGLRQDPDGLEVAISRFTALDERSGLRIERLSGAFDGALTRATAAFVATSGATRVTGTVTATPVASGRRLVGDLDLTTLNLADVLEDPDWQSDITGRATIAIAMPGGGQRASLAFTFTGPRATAFGYEGADLDFTGGLEDSRLTFAGRANGYGAAITIDAAWQLTDTAGARTGLTSTGTFRRVDLRLVPGTLNMPRLASTLAGRYRLEYSARGWTADATLQDSQLEGALIAAGTVGRLDTRSGSIRYSAEGRLSGLNVGRLAEPLALTVLSQPRFESRVNGWFHADGLVGTSAAPRHLAASATLDDSTIDRAKFTSADVALVLDGRRLTVSVRGDFSGVTPTLAGLPESTSFDLTGDADVDVAVADLDAPLTAESVDVSGHVTLGPSSVQGLTVTSATFDGSLAGGVADVQTLVVEAPGLRASAAGALALGAIGASALDVTVTADDLRGIGADLGRPLAGGLDLSMKVTGPADRLQATGTLNGHTLAYADSARALTLNTTFTAQMPDRDVDRLTLTGRTDGTFVQALGFELIQLSTTAEYANRQLTVDGHFEEAQRAVDLAGVVAFTPDGRAVALRRLAVHSAGTTWTLADGTEGHVAIGSDRIGVDGLVFTHDASRLSLTGAFALTPEGVSSETQLIAHAQDVQVSDINQLLLGNHPLEGVLNGEAVISGHRRAPVIDATFTVTDGAVDGVRYDRLTGTVGVVGSRATLDASLEHTAASRLTITGTVPLSAEAVEGSPSEAMDLRVTSTPIHLAIAQLVTSELQDIGGTGTFDVAVTGTRQAPVIDGSVTIDGGTFLVTGTGVRYRDLAAQLNFEDNRLQIGALQVVDDDGHTMRATGGVDLLGQGASRTVDLRLVADRLRVLNNQLGTILVNGEITVAGDVGAPRIAGSLRVDQGRIEVDRVLETTTKNVYSTRPQAPEDEQPALSPAEPVAPIPPVVGVDRPVIDRPAPATAPRPSLFDRVDLQLELEVPDNLVLRGRDVRAAGSPMGLGDMNIIAGGRLDVRKAPGGQAVVVGEMEIVRGYYSFQGRRFEVQRDSVVRFRGNTPIDPAIDVTAERAISGVQASVHIQGTARRPRIDISSQPSLDDADVLSLIVFGQPVNDLGTAQRSNLSERAASMAAGAIATPLADSVARALNLDLFEIQAPTADQRVPVVSVGSQIGTRLYVGLRQGIGGADASAVSIEYRVAEFLRLVTTVAQSAVEKQGASSRAEPSGLDLIFVFRY